MKNDVKAYKCEVCNGTGKENGSTCTNCQGSGFIGRDGTYEYILTRNENNQLVITDIKMPLEQLEKTERTENTKEDDWGKKVRQFWKMMFSALLVIIILASLALYFTVFSGESTLITVAAISLLLLILLNISKLRLFERLIDLVKKMWEEPNDFLKYLKERLKEE